MGNAALAAAMPEEGPAILLVEDSAVHQKLLREAFRQVPGAPALRFFSDGETAWEFVKQMVLLPPSRWPRLAIVDLGLPGVSGIELLARIRSLIQLSEWPVLVLTASDKGTDISDARDEHASAYILKPKDLAGYQDLARDVVGFWMKRSR